MLNQLLIHSDAWRPIGNKKKIIQYSCDQLELMNQWTTLKKDHHLYIYLLDERGVCWTAKMALLLHQIWMHEIKYFSNPLLPLFDIRIVVFRYGNYVISYFPVLLIIQVVMPFLFFSRKSASLLADVNDTDIT